MVIFHVGDSSMSEEDVYDIKAIKISRFMIENFPGLISALME